jgi:hypothetical protein
MVWCATGVRGGTYLELSNSVFPPEMERLGVQRGLQRRIAVLNLIMSQVDQFCSYCKPDFDIAGKVIWVELRCKAAKGLQITPPCQVNLSFWIIDHRSLQQI